VSREIELSYKIKNERISVEHTFVPSKVRLEFLKSRIDHVLRPTVAMLEGKRLLAADWQSSLRSSLFCCPFLTVNLLAASVPDGTLSERYTLPIKLLGLCMAVELGAEEHSGDSPITELVDGIFE
ncbi:MAG TPA: hypothetical protein V6C72_17275, partial [Chroococcales cyanobacterium]